MELKILFINNITQKIITVKFMKSLEELKKLRKEWLEEKRKNIETEEDEELYNKWLNYNFLAYSVDSDSVSLFDSYDKAKNYCDNGGQVLVIDKDKVYTYKAKSEEEYQEYLSNQIKYENLNKRNYFGI